MSLSTKVKTHKIIFKPESGRKPIYVGSLKANAYRAFLADKSAYYIDITDENGEYVETIKKFDIDTVQRIDKEDKPVTNKYICDYGTRHYFHEKCECSEKYGVLFPIWCRDEKGVKYPGEITEAMQKQYLSLNPK